MPRTPAKPDIRPHGFPGARHFVTPPDTLAAAGRHPLLRDLRVTAAGHFPHAAGHLVARTAGVPDHIVILCVQGSGWCRFGGRHWRLRAGEAIWIPPDTPHAYGTTKRRPWSIYWLHAAGARAEAYRRELELSDAQPLLATDASGALGPQFEALLEHQRLAFTPRHALAGATAAAHLLALLALHRGAPRADGQSARDRVRGSAEFLRRHLGRRVMVAECAKAAGLSAPHFTALFHRAHGCAPLAYLLRLRIQEAGLRLATTDAPVREIAAATGFADPLYFSRVFHRLAGAAPRAFRARHRVPGAADA